MPEGTVVHYREAGSIQEGELRSFLSGERRLLLLRHQGELHCIDNRCGHFGVPLQGGQLEAGVIRCPVHGITFSLQDGSVVNRPWERCRSIAIHRVEPLGEDVLIHLSP